MFGKMFERLMPMYDTEPMGGPVTDPAGENDPEPADPDANNPEPGADTGENDPEPADPAQPPAQSQQENAAFAAMRRENERLIREMQERDDIFSNFFPDSKNPLEAAMMQVYGKTPEQIAAERAAAEERQRMEAELEELRKFRDQNTFERDLSAIKAAYPDVKAQSVNDLGPEFARIMAAGGLDAVTAYEVVRAKEAKVQKTAPTEIGKVGASIAPEKDFYTAEEVRRMNEDEVTKNFEKIEKSMSRW